MKNFNAFLLAFVLLMGWTACNKGGKTGKTAGGNDYTFHTKGSGNTAKDGDYVFADFYIRKDTALIFSTAMQGQTARFPVESTKDIKDPIFKLIMEGLKMMTKGDSATFILKLDTMKVKPQGFDGAKEARITLAVKNLMNEGEFVATLKPEEKQSFEMMKVMKVRAKGVKDSCDVLAKNYSAGTFPAGVQTTASGLKYAVLRAGTGAMPKKGQAVAVHYYGSLKSGEVFDQSYERGQPISFPIGAGQVIPGWDEGIALMKEGETGVLFVPSALAYGDKVDPNGPIPANSDLMFYVELVKVIDMKAPQAGMPQMPPGQ
jgi:FKBP-type peptidyl-prolyl cis-trans isomerase FkpA